MYHPIGINSSHFFFFFFGGGGVGGWLGWVMVGVGGCFICINVQLPWYQLIVSSFESPLITANAVSCSLEIRMHD